MDTFTFQEALEVEECCNCHMAFAMTTQFVRARRKDHNSFYCPAGHSQHYYGKSEETKLRNRLADTQEEVNRERGMRVDAEHKTKTVAHQRNAFKGHLKRTKRRIFSGVCPCCNRTFKQLARHMAGQHPEYGDN